MANLIYELQWDERFSHWMGLVNFPSGRVVSVTVRSPSEHLQNSPNIQETCDTVALAAEPHLIWFLANEKVLYESVAQELLHYHNQFWNDEAPITQEEFADRLYLMDVFFQLPPNGFDLSIGANGLFGRHFVTAFCDENRQLSRFGVDG